MQQYFIEGEDDFVACCRKNNIPIYMTTFSFLVLGWSCTGFIRLTGFKIVVVIALCMPFVQFLN